MKRGVDRDPGYFDKISVYGGDEYSDDYDECPSCGKYSSYNEPPVDDIFAESTPVQNNNVVAGSTEDYLTGGADNDDYEPII